MQLAASGSRSSAGGSRERTATAAHGVRRASRRESSRTSRCMRSRRWLRRGGSTRQRGWRSASWSRCSRDLRQGGRHRRSVAVPKRRRSRTAARGHDPEPALPRGRRCPTRTRSPGLAQGRAPAIRSPGLPGGRERNWGQGGVLGKGRCTCCWLRALLSCRAASAADGLGPSAQDPQPRAPNPARNQAALGDGGRSLQP